MLLENFGRGLEDLGRSLEVKTGGSNPKTSKTRISLFNWKFPEVLGGEIYIVFDEESEFEVKIDQFGRPGAKT